jgi:hypothetical protein
MTRPCISLASWPGAHHLDAAEALLDRTVVEPLWGEISPRNVQLVPQSFGQLTQSFVVALRERWPGSRFRLHANVQVLPRRVVAELVDFDRHADWFGQAARINAALGHPDYVAHPGDRRKGTLGEAMRNAKRCEDLFGARVGIEGQYPVLGDRLLCSSWSEYRRLLQSDVCFALDLSHLNILTTSSGLVERSLLQELLACERCLEVHVSANDGTGDWHQVCHEPPWWLDLLTHVNPDAVVFSEGNQRRSRKDTHANY